MNSGKKANLFIVGAMKAGTTSFNQMLSLHPEIYFSPIKEPNYFVKNFPESIYKESPYFSSEKYFRNDFPKNLHIARIKDYNQYQTLFSLAKNETYLAEGSTSYLHAPESAKLIYDYNPQAKIIILIRDEIKRAISHYKMDVGLGKTVDTFENLIKNNLNQIKSNHIDPWSYIGMSLYKDNIQRFKEYFGENVLVIKFEDFVSNKEKSIEDLFAFLNLAPQNIGLEKTNESVNLRFKRGLYFLKQTGLKDFFSYILPKRFRHFLFKKMQKRHPEPVKISVELENDLKQLFHNEFLKD